METPTAESPKGLASLRDLLPQGVLPTNLSELDTPQGGAAAIERMNRQSKAKNRAPVPPQSPNQPSRDPTPAIQADPKNPAPSFEAPAPQPVVEPTPEPQTQELTSEEFPESALLDVLEAPEAPAKPKVEPKSTAPTDIDADPDAPIEIPKTAKAQTDAIITLSKKSRELQKTLKIKEAKIAELITNGNIDTAVQAQEPLKARIAELETERQQLQGLVASTNLERRPEFQQLIRPQIMATNYINELAKTTPELDTRAIFSATGIQDMSQRKQAVRAACADLPPDEIAQAIQAIEAIHIVGNQVAQVRANASQIEANLRKTEQEKASAAQAHRRSASVKAHEEVHQEFIADPVLKEFLSKSPEDKKQFDSLLEKAKAAELDPSYATDPKKLARAIQQSLAYQPTVQLYQKQLKTVLAKLKTVMAENLKYKQPAAGLSPRSTYTPPASNGPMTTESIVKGAFAGVRSQM